MRCVVCDIKTRPGKRAAHSLLEIRRKAGRAAPRTGSPGLKVSGRRCDAAPTDESMLVSNTCVRFRRLSSVAAIQMMPSGPFLARICTE